LVEVIAPSWGQALDTLEEPTKVSPQTQTLKLAGPKSTHSFPGNSLTVMRVKATQPSAAK